MTKRGGLGPPNWCKHTIYFFIEISVLNKESERSRICLLGVSSLHLSVTFLLDFRTVSTVIFFIFHFFFSPGKNVYIKLLF